jgi:hypothetical protein
MTLLGCLLIVPMVSGIATGVSPSTASLDG